MPLLPPSSSRRRSSERGSALIVALIFATAIALTLGSYLSLAQSTLRAAHRSHYDQVALNLAETGLERGMHAVSRKAEGAEDAWAGWDVAGNDAYRTFTGFELDANAQARVRVRVQDHLSEGQPVVLARATLEPARGAAIEKWLRVTCGKTSPFGHGVIGRKVVITGRSRLNSYSSARGDYGAPLADGSLNINDDVFVGAALLQRDTLSEGAAIVEGTVAVAGEDGLQLGSDASIGPFGTRGIASDFLRYDFTRDYDDLSAPATEAAIIPRITSSLTLPRPADVPVLVSGRKTYYYRVTEGIALSEGEAQLVVETTAGDGSASTEGADVVIIVHANISVSSPGAGVRVAPKHSLAIYTAGDVSLGGAGVENLGHPAQFQLWGTRPQSEPVPQALYLKGHDGELRGVVYAPNGDVSVRGGSGSEGSAVLGAVVGRDVKISGDFHYDEALRRYDQRYAYRVTRWEELTTGALRASVAAGLEF